MFRHMGHLPRPKVTEGRGWMQGRAYPVAYTEGMHSSVWSWTLAEFCDRTAAPTPTPSGGSAAPVCAAFGLGLVLMGLEITRKGADTDLAAAIDPLLSSGREILARLSSHPDRDITAFQEHLKARSLPKGTAEEKALRQEQMQTTLSAATEAPLAAARDIAAALGIASQAAKLCKRQILSDLVAGTDLLSGSLSAVLRSVDANIPGLSDLALRERFLKEREALAASVLPYTLDPQTRTGP
jgi:formiminotetrahydrofolate cyclodeaminase